MHEFLFRGLSQAQHIPVTRSVRAVLPGAVRNVQASMYRQTIRVQGQYTGNKGLYLNTPPQYMAKTSGLQSVHDDAVMKNVQVTKDCKKRSAMQVTTRDNISQPDVQQ